MLNRTIDFLTTNIWKIEFDELPTHQRVLLRPLRVLVLAVRGFDEDRIQVRASALTFYSLLSMVPALAVAFGIAKGFDLRDALLGALAEVTQGQEDAFQQIVQWADNMLAETRGGIVAGVGVVFLLWAVVRLLSTIELSLNDIWGLPRGRAFGRRIVDYVAIILLAPILLTTSSALTTTVVSLVREFTRDRVLLDWAHGLVGGGLPYAVSILFFGILYRFMPNTHVTFRAAFLGGVVAGLVYQVSQWGYIMFQQYVSDVNAIYGTFTAIPFFLVWLNLSWLVILFGAEIAYAVDNEETYAIDRDWADVSRHVHRLLALRFTEQIAKRFTDGGAPLTAADLGQEVELPTRLVRSILYDLVAAGVLIEIDRGRSEESAFQPARAVSGLTIKWVIDALDHVGQEPENSLRDADLERLSGRLGAMDTLVRDSSDNVPLNTL